MLPGGFSLRRVLSTTSVPYASWGLFSTTGPIHHISPLCFLGAFLYDGSYPPHQSPMHPGGFSLRRVLSTTSVPYASWGLFSTTGPIHHISPLCILGAFLYDGSYPP